MPEHDPDNYAYGGWIPFYPPIPHIYKEGWVQGWRKVPNHSDYEEWEFSVGVKGKIFQYHVSSNYPEHHELHPATMVAEAKAKRLHEAIIDILHHISK
jgi:hypothetical protein